MEVERKYDVDDATQLPDWTTLVQVTAVGDAEVRDLDARYFDTGDLRLAAAGVALRRRTGGPDEGWHVKVSAAEGRHEYHWDVGEESAPIPDAVARAVAHWAAPPFERGLAPGNPAQAAFMMAIRRAGHGASYEPYRPGVVPWHAAMAATYAHATAPLRRLADRYVVRAALAIAGGRPVPAAVADAFARLPPVMARAGALGGRIDRAVIDLAEAVMLQSRVGERFAAIVTDLDDRGARIQLCDLPIVARVDAHGVAPGEPIALTLVEADPTARLVRFVRAS